MSTYTAVAANLSGGTYTNTGLAANTTYYYIVTTGHINGGEPGRLVQRLILDKSSGSLKKSE